MSQTHYYLTLITAIGCGLIAGTFFVFSVAVMDALRRLPANDAISAMQSINIVIVNPIFLSVFVGTAVLSIGVSAISVLNWNSLGSTYSLVGSLLYFLGTFVVTIALNVPLNNSLAAADPTTTAGHEIWNRYLTNWTFWNHIRAAAATASLAMLIVGLADQK